MSDIGDSLGIRGGAGATAVDSFVEVSEFVRHSIRLDGGKVSWWKRGGKGGRRTM